MTIDCVTSLHSMYTIYVNVLTYLLVNFRSSQNLAGELAQPQQTRQDGPVRVVPGVKASPCTVTERRIPEMIPVLGSQPAGEVSHKPRGRLPILSARPAVTPATLKRAATNFAAWCEQFA